MPQVDFNRIATNIAGLQTMNALSTINNRLATHQTRLATGRRINEAADDPAGLTIATKFRARSEGLGQALANIGDAKSLLAVAEGGLTKINDILVQMQKKATQAASDTLGASERAAIAQDLKEFADEINKIVAETKWNGVELLGSNFTGGSASSLTFQTGSEAGEVMAFSFAGLASDGGFVASVLGVATIQVDTHANASAYLASVQGAIAMVSEGLQKIGAVTARLAFKEEVVTIARTNVEAAYNRIMNADMAAEQLEATKYQILQQTATAMLAQANSAPQSVLSLFR